MYTYICVCCYSNIFVHRHTYIATVSILTSLLRYIRIVCIRGLDSRNCIDLKCAYCMHTFVHTYVSYSVCFQTNCIGYNSCTCINTYDKLRTYVLAYYQHMYMYYTYGYMVFRVHNIYTYKVLYTYYELLIIIMALCNQQHNSWWYIRTGIYLLVYATHGNW